MSKQLEMHSSQLLVHLLFFICLFTSSTPQSIGDRVVLGPAPPISSSPNLADQLTKNRYEANEFRALLPEEVTNRLLAAQGITRIENKYLPHPDRNNGNELENQPKKTILLGSTQDLSDLPKSNLPPDQHIKSRFGEDLTEQTLFSNVKKGGKTSPFGKRNRLFTLGKYSEKNGDVDLLETRPSLWSDASELIEKLGESSSAAITKAQGFAPSTESLPSRLIQESSQHLQNENGQVNGAPFGQFLPSFVVNHRNSKQENLQDFSNFRQPNSGYQLLIQPYLNNSYNNMQPSSFGRNYQPSGAQMPNSRDARKYSTDFEINPVNRFTIEPSSSSNPLVQSPMAPIQQPSAEDSRSLGRFDTNLDRFSKEPIDEFSRQRVVLNPLDPAFQSGITVDSFLKRPTNFGKPTNQGAPLQREPIGRQSMATQTNIFPPYGYSQHQNNNIGQISPVRNVVVAGSEAADRTVASMPGVISLENSSGAKTTMLTNNRIPAWDEASPRSGGGYVFEKAPTTPFPDNLENKRQENKQFTTYPNYRDPSRLFPVLANHVKEDPRPASGRRDGPQGRFGGGTNEYREDLGQRAPITGINDQRQPGAIGGAYAWERLPQVPLPPLNQFSGNVAVKNIPAGPYPNRTAINTINSRRTVLGGDDLSNSDVAGHVDFGQRVNAEFTTAAPYLYGSVTTVIGVPLDSYEGSGNKDGMGPASRMIGAGFNPIIDRVVIGPREGNRQSGTISKYQGPEEITGSRYRELDETRNAANGGTGGRGPNRYVKMELLNE